DRRAPGALAGDLSPEIAGHTIKIGPPHAESYIGERGQRRLELDLQLAIGDAAYAPIKGVAAHLLAVQHPANERQRHVASGRFGGGAPLRPAAAQAAELVQRDRRVEALQLNMDGWRDVGERTEIAQCRFRDQNLAANRAALDTAREVHRSADHRVLRPLL